MGMIKRIDDADTLISVFNEVWDCEVLEMGSLGDGTWESAFMKVFGQALSKEALATCRKLKKTCDKAQRRLVLHPSPFGLGICTNLIDAKEMDAELARESMEKLLHTLKFPVYVAITDSGELGDPRFQVTFSFEDKLGWKRGELDRLLGMLKES